MGDLVVRQPRLGRESIVLLGRIVDSGADGLAQDDIEPYLLVRLLRCGYIRRQHPDAAAFVATPTGIERCRIETIEARRRAEEQDRREIIRGRLQAMVARMERDYPALLPPPTLADFRLPTIYQRALRVAEEPAQPAPRADGLRLGPHGGQLVTRDDRARMIRDDASRASPEDALSVIRESERRAIRERALPVIQADDLLRPGEDGRLVIRVGRLPGKRKAELPAVREHTVPAARENGAPPILLVPLVDDLPDPAARSGDARFDDDDSQSASSGAGGGWQRAAVVTAVAAVALLVGDPALRYLSPSVEVWPHAPIAQSPMLPAPKLAAADEVVRKSSAEPSRPTAPVRSVADRVLPPSDVATGAATVVAAVRAPAPPAVTPGPHPNVSDDRLAPALVVAVPDREPVTIHDASESRSRPASETPSPAILTRVADVAPTTRTDSTAAAVVPAVAPPPAVTMSPTIAVTPRAASPAVGATASAVIAPTAPPPPVAAMPSVVIAPPAVAAPSEPVRITRKLNHATPGPTDTLLFASASVNAPVDRRDARTEPQTNTATRVPDRLSADAHSDELAVDRLNTLSLLAALQGKPFSPPRVTADIQSRRATSPGQVPPPSLP